MKLYECWEDGDGGGLTVFASDNDVARSTLDAGARLLYRIEAKSWKDVMAEHHKRQGWEPYQP